MQTVYPDADYAFQVCVWFPRRVPRHAVVLKHSEDAALRQVCYNIRRVVCMYVHCTVIRHLYLSSYY